MNFNKTHLIYAASYYMAAIDGTHDSWRTEIKWIETNLTLPSGIWDIWNFHHNAGGLANVEKEILQAANKCGDDFNAEMIAYMYKVARVHNPKVNYNSDGQLLTAEGKFGNTSEEQLLNRFITTLNIPWSKIIEKYKQLF
jgi:hypothetical protein